MSTESREQEMDEYWDSEDQWADEPKCIVCNARSQDIVCSGTCNDILNLKQGELI